jgi:para-aminobenzoate synthetase/4-amino-4-deoxychorismate lyase
MKGTAKRGRITDEDRRQAQWLRNSEKNRAENVMIVDMVRNDLGRIAETGSVQVPDLFSVERYPTLWQMTSTVTARTRASVTEIFRALFPCASITGAPKVSTMRIISELETMPRRVYTGSIGYISPNREAKFNVAIRTALIDRATGCAEYGVGGGIVWDSIETEEYTEALLKGRVLTEDPGKFSLLETMLWTPEGGYFLREKHLARLLDSASYFGVPISREVLDGCLDQAAHRFRSARRVRLLVEENRIVNLEWTSHTPEETDRPLRVHLAKEPVSSKNLYLFHKTTRREVYESARKEYPDFDDVLLYNQTGELTEFTIGNLVVELGGKMLTPPIFCGVLAGTFRARLLETGQIQEGIIPIKQLESCTRIFRVNSVHRWQRVEITG